MIKHHKKHKLASILATALTTSLTSGFINAETINITNPSFENSFEGWTDIDPSSVSGVAYQGSKSAKMSGSNGRVEQSLTIDSNTTYTLTAYVVGGGKLGVSGSGLNESTNISSSDWQQASVSFNSGSATSVTIYGEYFGNEGRFDSFELTTSSDTTEPSEPTTPVTCTGSSALSVVAATDNGTNDGHGPSNTIDNSYDTESRWSSNGEGKTITYDLGVQSEVKSVSVAWFKGNERASYFDMETSADGSSWTSVLSSGQSSGSNAGLEEYDVTDTSAQLVRITGYGNSSNTWNSIVETKINGCSDGSAPTDPTDPTEPSNPIGNLDPDLPPSGNFELVDWTLGVPVDENNDGKSDTIKEIELSSGYSRSPYFFTAADGGMVFRCPIDAPKTSTNTSYARTELREMLRRGDTSYSTQGVGGNNWVFSSAPSLDQNAAGGVDGTLEATLAVNYVTTTGDSSQVGRVIVGQIHANDDEPLRLYYRKLPSNSKGSIYIAHEPITGSEQYYEMIGSRSSSASDPADGISLDEKFSYQVKVVGNTLTVTIMREGKADVVEEVNMSGSSYDAGDQYMYFKAGVYNQNNTGDADDYVQATFYKLSNKHNGYAY
ncbi:polysaccharide lyase family 7 protein [uncultured Shewanella sp.]|uniref:polysaccharide lyase family 7 protein n=1 Tax=uncultured Shewanella sp. TaxID=173975 RepID=UPI00260D1EE8|nr:polysaccharide lyase family 7 protein [uncultured Shewanella sp.]